MFITLDEWRAYWIAYGASHPNERVTLQTIEGIWKFVEAQRRAEKKISASIPTRDVELGYITYLVNTGKLQLDICGDYEQEPLPPGWKPQPVDRRTSMSEFRSLL